MPKSTGVTEPSELGDRTKNYSCLTCRQRKVKCDKCNPCSNCVKSQKQCSFIAPVRGKRRKTKTPKEGLHAKLKRYEDLLKSYGAKVEPSEASDESNQDTASEPDTENNGSLVPDVTSRIDTNELERNQPKLIAKDGATIYFESALWSNLGENFQHPELDGFDESTDEGKMQDSELLFGFGPKSHVQTLESLHPPASVLSKLRDIYVDRVDPLIKILHIPTLWTALTKALQQPQNVSKNLQTVIFAFYLAAVSTMDDEETQSLFGAQQRTICARYRVAARQALVHAGFLSTSNLTTLQAYALYIMCVRSSYQSDTLYILSGVSIRLARRMGLHRDGTSLGMSPFETEMRRRLWWQLAQMDYRTADVLGTKPSQDLVGGDIKLPLNIADEDLYPEMKEMPPESNGIVPVTLCLIKCEISNVIYKFSTDREVRWEVFSDPGVSLGEKDNLINQTEDYFEKRYLRYCDPAEPLHTFISIMVRSAICKMRLFAHNPRQSARNSAEVPQSERDIVFANAMKFLEYTNFLREGHQGLHKYMWQIGTAYLWNALLYLLIEIRRRKPGAEVDRSWQLIGLVFSNFPSLFEKSAATVYAALGRWTVEVWNDYVAASIAEGFPKPTTPEYIEEFHQRQFKQKVQLSKPKTSTLYPEPLSYTSINQPEPSPPDSSAPLPELDTFASYDFPDLTSFELDPNEWTQWDQLLSDQTNFTFVSNV